MAWDCAKRMDTRTASVQSGMIVRIILPRDGERAETDRLQFELTGRRCLKVVRSTDLPADLKEGRAPDNGWMKGGERRDVRSMDNTRICAPFISLRLWLSDSNPHSFCDCVQCPPLGCCVGASAASTLHWRQ